MDSVIYLACAAMVIWLLFGAYLCYILAKQKDLERKIIQLERLSDEK